MMDQDPVSIRRVRRLLLQWGRAHYQHYAWRDEADPWLTLVAEFLLQRTRARQVEPAFHELRTHYPTADALADAGPGAARALLDRLGLFWRAPFLFRLATAVSERGGHPPETLDELRVLTGVGGYTSAAWLSLHRGKRAVIIDSNVARLLSRLTGNPYPSDPRHVKWIQHLADLLTPERAFRDYNYAILDFTMVVCTPRNPQCSTCPLRRDCAYGLGSHAEYTPTVPPAARAADTG